jgi:hypothetical protein
VITFEDEAEERAWVAFVAAYMAGRGQDSQSYAVKTADALVKELRERRPENVRNAVQKVPAVGPYR